MLFRSIEDMAKLGFLSDPEYKRYRQNLNVLNEGVALMEKGHSVNVTFSKAEGTAE